MSLAYKDKTRDTYAENRESGLIIVNLNVVIDLHSATIEIFHAPCTTHVYTKPVLGISVYIHTCMHAIIIAITDRSLIFANWSCTIVPSILVHSARVYSFGSIRMLVTYIYVITCVLCYLINTYVDSVSCCQLVSATRMLKNLNFKHQASLTSSKHLSSSSTCLLLAKF